MKSICQKLFFVLLNCLRLAFSEAKLKEVKASKVPLNKLTKKLEDDFKEPDIDLNFEWAKTMIEFYPYGPPELQYLILALEELVFFGGATR